MRAAKIWCGTRSPAPCHFPVVVDIAAAFAGFTLVFTAAMHLHRRSMPRRM
ncbi:hypothetical protein [Methanoculleus sp.]|uniref:hypothetical protein n=1 Tax=Methanoculleus sp. TaxID=90427 RepID=UPI002D1FB7EF|nr:hypothetical protein [Methanoculleus sp.]